MSRASAAWQRPAEYAGGTLAEGAVVDAETIAGHRTRVFRFILKSVRSPSDAEDLAQRTLLTALASRPKFRGESSVLTWLLGIALNMVRAHRRARRMATLHDGDEALATLPSKDPDPATDLARRQEIQRVRDAVGALPDEMREVVILVSLEGLDYESAAAVLDIPIGTVRSRLHRAKQMLRECLMANEMAPARTHAGVGSSARAPGQSGGTAKVRAQR